MIYTLKTIDKKEYPVEIDPDVTTTDALYELVASTHGLDKSLMKLIHVGKILKDNKKLSEFGIADEPQKNFGVLLITKAKPAPAPAPVFPTPRGFRDLMWWFRPQLLSQLLRLWRSICPALLLLQQHQRLQQLQQQMYQQLHQQMYQ